MRARLTLVPDRLIRGLCIFVAAAATLGSCLFIYFGRQNAIHRADAELKNYAFVLVEQTDRALQAVEFVQKDIIERIRYEVSLGYQNFDRAATSDGIFKALADKSEELPHASGMSIIRADGEVLATAKGRGNHIPQSVADRQYFVDAINAPKDVSSISNVVRSRLSGRYVIIVSRKITTADGILMGIINVALDIDFFEKLFRSLIATNTLETRLVSRNGSSLAQFPRVSHFIKTAHFDAKLYPTTSVSGPVTVDVVSPKGERRLVATKSSATFPVSIQISDTYHSFLADWRMQALGIAVVAVIMNIAIIVAFLAGRRHMKASIRQAVKESHLARQDVLTKVPNRLHFLEQMDCACWAIAETSREFALLVIDLNRFKEVNDTMGHPTGDRMIQSVAYRIQENLRPGDFMARIGGDEFAMILKNLASLEEVKDYVRRLAEILSEPHHIGSKSLQVTCAIGISIGTRHGSTTDELLKAADLALYAAKAEAGASHRFYDAELNAERLKRRSLEAALPLAIENGEFELHYQPIMSLKTGRCWGFESLVRWRRPGHGLVSPAEFIPALEDFGLVTKLGQRILIDACATAAKWPGQLHVAVNVSPIQLGSDDVIEHIRLALDKSSLRPSRLSIEVTESVMLGDGAVDRLRRIRKMGVSIALDDFGTGFASMSYLESYPYDKIKIDRSFVANMANPKSRAIVEATIKLARALKIETTAEGVETEQQLAELRAAGASQAQGYLFARPMPEEEITNFLQQVKPTKAAGASVIVLRPRVAQALL